MTIRQALENIVWKLERKEQAPDGSIVWAKIDINDATVRQAIAALESDGTPYSFPADDAPYMPD